MPQHAQRKVQAEQPNVMFLSHCIQNPRDCQQDFPRQHPDKLKQAANMAATCAPQREPFTPVFCWLCSYNFLTLYKVLFWIAVAQNLTSCLFFQKYCFFFVWLFFFFLWSVIFHKNCCWFLKILPFVGKKSFDGKKYDFTHFLWLFTENLNWEKIYLKIFRNPKEKKTMHKTKLKSRLKNFDKTFYSRRIVSFL